MTQSFTAIESHTVCLSPSKGNPQTHDCGLRVERLNPEHDLCQIRYVRGTVCAIRLEGGGRGEGGGGRGERELL